MKRCFLSMKRCFLKLKYHDFMRFSVTPKRINVRNVYLIYIFISKIHPVKLEITNVNNQTVVLIAIPKRIYVRLLTSCDARKSILTWHPTNLPSDGLKWILKPSVSYSSFTCHRKMLYVYCSNLNLISKSESNLKYIIPASLQALQLF